MRKLVLLVACSLSSTPGQAQTPGRAWSGETAGAGDEIICRRFLRTGTLADYYRVCKTRGEWDQERRNIRQGLRVADSCRLSGSGIGCEGLRQ